MNTLLGQRIEDTIQVPSTLNKTQKESLSEDFLELSSKLHKLAAQLTGQ